MSDLTQLHFCLSTHCILVASLLFLNRCDYYFSLLSFREFLVEKDPLGLQARMEFQERVLEREESPEKWEILYASCLPSYCLTIIIFHVAGCHSMTVSHM